MKRMTTNGYLFQHTAARRRLVLIQASSGNTGMFQHTAARRRLILDLATFNASVCFNTQPPEGGCFSYKRFDIKIGFQHTAARRRLKAIAPCKDSPPCFNTQPPEGGWSLLHQHQHRKHCFNTQPPEGGWP